MLITYLPWNQPSSWIRVSERGALTGNTESDGDKEEEYYSTQGWVALTRITFKPELYHGLFYCSVAPNF